MEMTFVQWKAALKQDCANRGQLNAFDCLSDFVLESFFLDGIEPAVEAIIETAEASAC
jgi:hypothetical protein